MRMIILLVLLSVSAMAIAEEDGKQIFEARCAACHQLPEPAMLKPKQWRLVLMTMQKRMQQNGLAALSEEEFAQVLKYLTNQAGH
jgi:mono/diheme cytochrome c family protein